MCRKEKSGSQSLILSLFRPGDNPLYEYLIDLQKRRMQLLELLDPNRYARSTLLFLPFVIFLYVMEVVVDPVGTDDFFSMFLITLGPIGLIFVIFTSGWKSQMEVVANYPSPLDNPHALEMLLTTPLSEKEITTGVVAAYARFPFMMYNLRNFLLIALNVVVFFLAAILINMHKGGITGDTRLFNIVLATVSAMIFFPITSGLDVLLVSGRKLMREQSGSIDPGIASAAWGRNGRFGPFLLFISLLSWFLIGLLYQEYAIPVTGVVYELTRILPVNLIILATMVVILLAGTPGHLRKIRSK